MEAINKLLEEISAISFEIGSAVWVDVLHINNPHSFYVRPHTYNKYLPLLQQKGVPASIPEINLAGVYIFKSVTLESHVRGKIISCDQTGNGNVCYKMFAIDIGFAEDGVTPDRVWKTNYAQDVPPLAIHCHLGDCSPVGGTWKDSSVSAMRTFVEGERAKMIIKSIFPEFLVVTLYNSNPEDIATMMALTCNSIYDFSYGAGAAMRYGDNTEAKDTRYMVKELQVGEVFNVRMLSGSLFETFYVTSVEDYDYYLTDRDNYTTYSNAQRDVCMEDLKLNLPIGVFCPMNGKYERGIVKELLPAFNRAKLHLVDLGVEFEESVRKMKTLPAWYMWVPIRALWCTLDGNAPYSSIMDSMSYPGAEFQMSIKTLEGDNFTRPHRVVIPQLM